MSDEWNFYFCNIDDKFASISVDLGIADSIPIETLPFMAYIRLKMNLPDDNGMSSRDEGNVLNAIEEALNQELIRDENKYVGRCTNNSYRDFFFYITKNLGWNESVAKIMSSFPNYQYTSNVKSDKDWSLYRSFLYPSPADRQSIENRKVCMVLEENGDIMSEPREIEHWAYFPDRSNHNSFITAAMQLGFTVSSQDESNPVDRLKYSVCVRRLDIPSFENIDNVALPLFHLAIKYNGVYDGWGSPIIDRLAG